MRNLIFFDDDQWNRLLPLTFTRPVSELRCGIIRLREKWALLLNGEASWITQDYLSDKYPIRIQTDNWLINSAVLPSESLNPMIRELHQGEALLQGEELVAARLDKRQLNKLLDKDDFDEIRGLQLDDIQVQFIHHPWDLFRLAAQEIMSDFRLLTLGRQSAPIPSGTFITEPDQVFIESGAIVRPCFINASEGPVYIGKNVEVMEGAMIRGPVALCTGTTVKMGTRIYGPSTIGPYCKIGGEISNSVIQAYTNKAHDGFMGNSVIGEWCNIGADTNISNLKNTYDPIRLWNYVTERFEHTGQQFLGLIMGDHAKCGINTMFNTGTVVGVGANIFGDGYPRNFIPSFSWGGAAGFQTHPFEKMVATAETVFSRRNKILSPDDIVILRRIYEDSARYRTWEKASQK